MVITDMMGTESDIIIYLLVSLLVVSCIVIVHYGIILCMPIIIIILVLGIPYHGLKGGGGHMGILGAYGNTGL